MPHRPDQTYTAVRAELMEWLEGREETPREAVAIMTDPANEILCEVCGWTVGMICPECPGCGCYNGQCSGWRHGEWENGDSDDGFDEDGCEECGGSLSLVGYDAGCIC